MATLLLSRANFASLKKTLHFFYPSLRSSHLDESLAQSLGFRSYAAMRAAEREVDLDFPTFCVADERRFFDKLVKFGVILDSVVDNIGEKSLPEFRFHQLFPIVDGLKSTEPIFGRIRNYNEVGSRAWRTLMIAGINEGLKRKKFSLLFNGLDDIGPIHDLSELHDKNNRPPGSEIIFKFVAGLIAKASFWCMADGLIFVTVMLFKNSSIDSPMDSDSQVALAFGILVRSKSLFITRASIPGDNLFISNHELSALLADSNILPLGFGDGSGTAIP